MTALKVIDYGDPKITVDADSFKFYVSTHEDGKNRPRAYDSLRQAQDACDAQVKRQQAQSREKLNIPVIFKGKPDVLTGVHAGNLNLLLKSRQPTGYSSKPFFSLPGVEGALTEQRRYSRAAQAYSNYLSRSFEVNILDPTRTRYSPVKEHLVAVANLKMNFAIAEAEAAKGIKTFADFLKEETGGGDDDDDE